MDRLKSSSANSIGCLTHPEIAKMRSIPPLAESVPLAGVAVGRLQSSLPLEDLQATQPSAAQPHVQGRGSAVLAAQVGCDARCSEVGARPLAALRVLVVHHQPEVCHRLCGLLKASDTQRQVQVSHTSFEAGWDFHVFQPHLVMLDLFMIGLDSQTTCRHIKASRGDEVSIIALSFRNLPHLKKAAMQYGAQSLLSEPFDSQIVEAEVRKALGLWL